MAKSASLTARNMSGASRILILTLPPAALCLASPQRIAMRNYWSSQSATTKGSRNLSGIKDPVIDALIEKMIGAKNRAELVIAARALDRVLRAGHYWVPQWYYPFHRMAYWDKFGKPAQKPPYDRAIIDTWWVDPQKEANLKKK